MIPVLELASPHHLWIFESAKLSRTEHTVLDEPLVTLHNEYLLRTLCEPIGYFLFVTILHS